MEIKKLREEIHQRRQPEHRFIKWWRREHDFLNYDLIEVFLADISQRSVDMLEDFELLAEDQIWRELEQRASGHVHRERRTHGEVIVWEHDQQEEVRPYTPETMLSILDAETRSNVID
jgi:hypothetical protein